jgi:hypothetical protein
MYIGPLTYSQIGYMMIQAYMATFDKIFKMHQVACKIFHFIKF